MQQPEPVTGESVQRVKRWGRKQQGEQAESAAYVAAPALPLHRSYPGADRFRASGLRPEDERIPRPRKRLDEWLRPTRALDRVLLGVEIAGALLVAWIAWQYLYTTYFDTGPKRLTPSRSAGVLTKAAATPTPTRFVEILPPVVGGPDDEPMTGRPPTTATTDTSTPTPTVPTEMLLPSRLRIPVMFLDSPVHEVTLNMGEWEVSPMEIGHHEGTGVPGVTGNVVLAGHRDINSALFRELDRLVPGDEIFVSNALGEYKYIVSDVLEVSPDHIEVMDPTDDKRVTLITCTPPGIATRRLIVVALLDEASGQ